MQQTTRKNNRINIENIQDILLKWKSWQVAQGLSERTVYERGLIINNYLTFTGEKATEISPVGIVAFIGRPELAARTRTSYYATIHAFCQWLILVDYRTDDPTRKVPSPKRSRSLPRPLLDNQFVEVLRNAKDEDARLMIMLYACAGVRSFEIAKLHDNDLDLQAGVMTITGKGGKVAMVPLQDDLWVELRRHRSNKHGYVFPSDRNPSGHVVRHHVYAKIKAAMVAAHVEGTPHQLRHWYGTSLLKAGNDIRIVQELMRHESTATTQIYTRVDVRMRRAGIDKLKLPNVPNE